MTYLRYLCAVLVPGLIACGSQPDAPVSVIAPDAPWTCVGDANNAWRCARGKVPDVEQPEPAGQEPEPADTQPGLAGEDPRFAIGTAAAVAAEAVILRGTSQAGGNSAQAAPSGDNDMAAEPVAMGGHLSGSDEQSVLAAPDSYYAVQVVAANSAAAVAGYFEASGDNESAVALNVKIWSQGRDWYVGIAGLYPDYASAASALQALPETATPWIRPVKGLKQAILAARRP